MTGPRLGLALEFGSEQYGALSARAREMVGFAEYGLQLHRGIPGWVDELRTSMQSGLVLHPLDVNLAGQEIASDAWCDELARLVRETRAEALVSDMGFWYHGHRAAMWPRPPWMGAAGQVCRDIAGDIAARCGVRFRVENPPIEWMPGEVSLWRFLETASDDRSVDICLDVSHLLQFSANVHGRTPRLPRDFPWHRVAEIHLAGFIVIEYQGVVRCIDRHAAEIGREQFELVIEVLERTQGQPLDICLEMENRAAISYETALDTLMTLLAAR